MSPVNVFNSEAVVLSMCLHVLFVLAMVGGELIIYSAVSSTAIFSLIDFCCVPCINNQNVLLWFVHVGQPQHPTSL